MSTTVKNPRATKKFKGLLALLGSDELAVVAWNTAEPDSQIVVEVAEPSDEVATLMKAGFNRQQAEAALAAAKSTDTSAAPEPEAPLTSHEQGEILVAKEGLVPVRGRVYSGPSLIEAQARVLKTGKPEVIRNAGSHRTKAVLVYRMDDKQSVALQNYGEQN